VLFRSIPYTLHANGRATGTSVGVDFRNTGDATGVFHVRSADAAHQPRNYTVEPGRQLTDTWDGTAGYDLAVHGPNGFFRRFKGAGNQSRVDIRARYDERGCGITLDVTNRGSARIDVTIADRYSSKATRLSLRPGDSKSPDWSLSRTHGWYDLTVTVAGDHAFEYRYAGHLETGRDSISDPAMGGLV